MKMTLSIKDRLVFSHLYPREGNLIAQTLVKDIIEKVKITQKEMKEVNFREVEGNSGVYMWDANIEPNEYEFTVEEGKFLKDQVSRLDKENKITQECIDLCVIIQKS